MTRIACTHQIRVSSIRKRFTLIEMLVVITIIGILAAMLMPALTKSLDSARVSSCSNSLKQIGVACVLYADSNRNILPDPAWGSWEDKLISGKLFGGTSTDYTIFRCPNDSVARTVTGKPRSYQANGYLWDTLSGAGPLGQSLKGNYQKCRKPLSGAVNLTEGFFSTSVVGSSSNSSRYETNSSQYTHPNTNLYLYLDVHVAVSPYTGTFGTPEWYKAWRIDIP